MEKSVMPPSRKITFVDIAQEAGVSAATVSLAMRGKSSIPAETRQRVLEAARALGYAPKAVAPRNAPAGVTDIGLLFKALPNTVEGNPFYSVVQAGVEAACRQYNLNLTVASLPTDTDSNILRDQTPRVLMENSVDGFLVVGMYLKEEDLEVFGQPDKPVVLVDGYSNTKRFDTVISANFEGAYEAVSYLINTGHKRIALVGSHEGAFPSIAERRNGYLRALKDHDIADRYLIDSPFDPRSASHAMLKALKSGLSITAIFAVNDVTAVWCIKTIKEFGLRVPEDISVIGYDDDLLAAHVSPPLTTMQVDKVAMGKVAVMALLNRLENPDSGLIDIHLRPQLLVRDSVRLHPV
jgi:LacI family transcriptional regulator